MTCRRHTHRVNITQVAYEQFSNRLEALIKNAGMSRKEITAEVERAYGPSLQVSFQDLSKYLSGETLPRLTKLAAIADVCGATHSEIALLVRSVAERKKA